MANAKIDGNRLLEFILFMLDQWGGGRGQAGKQRSSAVESALGPEHLQAIRLLDHAERRGGQLAYMQIGLHLYTLIKPGTTMADFRAFVEEHRRREQARQAARAVTQPEAPAADVPLDGRGMRVDQYVSDGVTFTRDDVRADRRWRHYRGATYATLGISAPAKRMGEEPWTYLGEARESSNGPGEGAQVLVGIRTSDMQYVAFDLGGSAVERVVYKNAEGAMRVRGVEEFLNGRFRPVDWVKPAPAHVSPAVDVPDPAALVLDALTRIEVDGQRVFPSLTHETVRHWLASAPIAPPKSDTAASTLAVGELKATPPPAVDVPTAEPPAAG